MRPIIYILKNRVPVPSDDNDVSLFVQQAKNNERIVKQEDIGDYFVSTVFLGVDYNYQQSMMLILLYSAS